MNKRGEMDFDEKEFVTYCILHVLLAFLSGTVGGVMDALGRKTWLLDRLGTIVAVLALDRVKRPTYCMYIVIIEEGLMLQHWSLVLKTIFLFRYLEDVISTSRDIRGCQTPFRLILESLVASPWRWSLLV